MSFSERLKALRAEHQMTQQMLADQMNVARTTVTGYETKNRQPSHEKLAVLASIFNVSVDYLLSGRAQTDSSAFSSHSEYESNMDHQIFTLYRKFNLHSKEELLKYMHLLELAQQEQMRLKK